MKKIPVLSNLSVLVITCFVGIETVLPKKAIAKDVDLQVGIVQRFGDRPIDERDEIVEAIEILSNSGDWLTVNWETENEKQNNSNLTPSLKGNLKTKKIALKVEKEFLPKATLDEKIILGSHGTFETAENDANFWRNLGIEVEIVQPGRWEVWAKRDVYQTPLLRRKLLRSLKKKNYNIPYLKSELVTEIAGVVLSIDGKEYRDNEIEITTQQNRVRVKTTSNKGKADRFYGGSLRLQPNAYGNFTLVNQVPLETYLRGVVPYEIGANAPREAVRSQTIIARTYALRNLRRFAADNYELCASTHCQVYKGLNGVNSVSDNAIAVTKGLVLTYNNELVDALYSSTTGGVTASFSDVWEGEERPYLKPVLDSPSNLWDLSRYPLANDAMVRHFLNLKDGFNETGRSVFRWNRERNLKDLNDDLRKYLIKNNHPLANFNTIENLEIIKRSSSGRILTLLAKTDLGNVKLYKNEVRSAFKPPISTLFYLEPIYNNSNELDGYKFIGGGFGHGVGLSQYGSYNLARLGWNASRILAFYYPGTNIEPLNDSIVFWQDEFSNK